MTLYSEAARPTLEEIDAYALSLIHILTLPTIA